MADEKIVFLASTLIEYFSAHLWPLRTATLLAKENFREQLLGF